MVFTVFCKAQTGRICYLVCFRRLCLANACKLLCFKGSTEQKQNSYGCFEGSRFCFSFQICFQTFQHKQVRPAENLVFHVHIYIYTIVYLYICVHIGLYIYIYTHIMTGTVAPNSVHRTHTRKCPGTPDKLADFPNRCSGAQYLVPASPMCPISCGAPKPYSPNPGS